MSSDTHEGKKCDSAANLEWKCDQCGNEYPLACKFCGVCGGKRPEFKKKEEDWWCQTCGVEQPAKYKFCSRCGMKQEDCCVAAEANQGSSEDHSPCKVHEDDNEHHHDEMGEQSGRISVILSIRRSQAAEGNELNAMFPQDEGEDLEATVDDSLMDAQPLVESQLRSIVHRESRNRSRSTLSGWEKESETRA
ncbi:expressed unknown protein [Seminavis robusta]|uniref:RanBP2-type domain-containing protein n=1 Tax=Seminavis robusta TaxID=568900 RepID=A0A9N8DQW1_9STRA|nr:expressed unknown protein [Seminavis robusta]|eukprot:Sro307_g113230.1 n/a (192) ;mRNA; r:25349-25924